LRFRALVAAQSPRSYQENPVDPLGKIIGILFAITLVAVAGYFIHRQRQTLRTLRTDTGMPTEQRRYLHKQSWRRVFGAVMLILLGAMLFGSVFLNYDPNPGVLPDDPAFDKEASRQAARLIGVYLMTMLLIVMAILALAVLDFWAIARFSVYQQKQLSLEHHALLEAELLAHKHRQAESNGTL